jgi:hypothetical protein
MKRVVSLLIVLVSLAVLVSAGRSRLGSSRISSFVVVPKVLLDKAAPLPRPPSFLPNSQWQEYHSARKAALASNPALLAEYKEILQEMDGQQKKVDGAMVKANPKATEAVTKLEALRAHNGVSTSSSSSAVSPMAVEDWKEIRAARTAAIQANPSLMAKSKKLLERMKALQSSLDAAMIKKDPSLSPIVKKFEGRPASLAANSSSIQAHTGR